MNRFIWISIGIFVGLIVIGGIVVVLLTGISGEGIEDVVKKEDKKETVEEKEERERVEELEDFYKEFTLTEEEKQTFLKDKETDFVDPEEVDRMLYVFYDREKPRSEELIDIVTDYIEETDYPITAYLMNNGDDMVQGQEVIKSLDMEYEHSDKNGIILIQINNGNVVRVMTPETLDNDLVGVD